MNDQRKRVFDGRIIQVETRNITLPNGAPLHMEVVWHPGGAAVVALDETLRICLLRQYRAVFEQWLWELPAGKRDHQEDPQLTARRELAEEAGLVAENWYELGVMISSPGVFSEQVYLYAATGLSQVGNRLEADELIEVHWIALHEACQWVLQGKINDAKSVIGILRAQALFAQLTPMTPLTPNTPPTPAAPGTP